jgi:hypothetical protein
LVVSRRRELLSCARWMRSLVIALLLCALCARVDAQGITAGGMALGHYRFPADNLSDITFTFTLEADPGNSAGVFWAHQFWFQGGDGGYLGLQTRGFLNGREVGRMAIFSVWNALDAVAAPGATAQTFDGEGVGYSVRLPYVFQPGTTYQFRLLGEGGGWWGVQLRNAATGAEVPMGRILVPTAWGQLQGATTNFTEVYLPLADCLSVPYGRMRFDVPIANGGALSAAVTDHYTYGVCARWANTFPTGHVLHHELGRAHDARPAPPSALSYALSAVGPGAATVHLRWQAPLGGPTRTSYQLAAGSAPGLSDLAVVSLPSTSTAFTARVQRGAYYVRMAAANAAMRT